ncbi:MAG: hypothetical protein ACR2HJ_07920 [Fimbriimonadales bacterium]
MSIWTLRKPRCHAAPLVMDRLEACVEQYGAHPVAQANKKDALRLGTGVLAKGI